MPGANLTNKSVWAVLATAVELMARAKKMTSLWIVEFLFMVPPPNEGLILGRLLTAEQWEFCGLITFLAFEPVR
jgi:hypothetical protein